jgi:hypothetical protein
MSLEKNAFQQASLQGRSSLVSEFFGFILANKKWWMVPLLFVFLLFAVVMFLAGTGAAPFIYTLF